MLKIIDVTTDTIFDAGIVNFGCGIIVMRCYYSEHPSHRRELRLVDNIGRILAKGDANGAIYRWQDGRYVLLHKPFWQ